MITSKLGDFNFYILDMEESLKDIDIDPFNYQLQYKAEEEKIHYNGICNNIPCAMCAIQEQCKNGKYKSKAIMESYKETNPEMFI